MRLEQRETGELERAASTGTQLWLHNQVPSEDAGLRVRILLAAWHPKEWAEVEE